MNALRKPGTSRNKHPLIIAAIGLGLCAGMANAASVVGETAGNNFPVLIYLQPETTPAKTQPAPVTLNSRGGLFTPRFQVANRGSRLLIGNDDPILHNAHLHENGTTIFNVATPKPGVTVSKPLAHAGMFNVSCDLHPNMQAWLAVIDTPYYVVLWEPGTFALEDIPAGDYQLHMWRPDRAEGVHSLTLNEHTQHVVRSE